jgi:hypothetical protein
MCLAIFWVVKSSSVVDGYQRFGGAHRLYLQGNKFLQKAGKQA